jgi:hypothetical protein
MDWLQICRWCWSYSNLGLKERNCCDFKDFEAVFHPIFKESILFSSRMHWTIPDSYCSMLFADSTVHDAYALFLFIMISMHIRTTMCVCLLLNCTLADGCAQQYSVPVFHTCWSDYILTTTTPKITTQCPLPLTCAWLVDIKFSVKQISQF